MNISTTIQLKIAITIPKGHPSGGGSCGGGGDCNSDGDSGGDCVCSDSNCDSCLL